MKECIDREGDRGYYTYTGSVPHDRYFLKPWRGSRRGDTIVSPFTGPCAHMYEKDGVRWCEKDGYPCTKLGCPNHTDGRDMRFVHAGKEAAVESLKKRDMRQTTPRVRVNDKDRQELYRLRWRKAWKQW